MNMISIPQILPENMESFVMQFSVKRKKLAAFTCLPIVAMAGVLFLFLNGWSKEKPPIKLGLVNTLSGLASTAGIPERNGAVIAVDHINKTGGINGHLHDN